MPNVPYLPHQPARPIGALPSTPVLLLGALGVVVVGGFLWSVLSAKPERLNANRKHKMFGRNGRRRSGHHRNGSCRSGGGPYLFPKDRAYPVPTLKCAKTALAYAAWPHNLQDAPDILRAMRRSKWGKRADIRAQMRHLAQRYRARYHRAPSSA